MADINYGDGTGLNDSQTSSGYAYTAMASPTVIETFDGAGNVNSIKFYNFVNNGRLRIWKGTESALVFSFDDYTEVVDVDLTGKGTGWITLTAPTDFTAFAVTASTALLFYSHSTTTTGTRFGRGNAAPNRYGYNSSDPPYSGNLSMSVGGTTHRLEVLIEGSFAGVTAYKDVTFKTSLEKLIFKDAAIKTTLESVLTYKDIAFKTSLSSYTISGVTKDKDGVALGSCKCFLMKDNLDNTASFISYTLSNAVTGAYTFNGIPDDDAQYFVIFWKDDTPHVFDVTDHVLQPSGS